MRWLLIFLITTLYGLEDFKQTGFTSLVKEYKNKQTQANVKQIFSRNFSLYPYKENYLLPATWDFKRQEGRKEFETKFQISVMKPFADNLLDKNEVYFFGYTQTSWWQTMSDSAPFRENNYQPEIFVMFPMERYHPNLDAIILALNHQSNGRDGEYSRSWNRIYTRFVFHYNEVIFNFRIWYRIPEKSKKYPTDPNGDDNPDIEDYLGYGDLKILFPYKDNLFTSFLRYNPSTEKGAIEITYSKPIRDKDIFLYCQYFYGYGESLIDYNNLVNKIGIGFEYSR